ALPIWSYSESEDITQEIFIKVYKELIKYNKDKASFRTWLYRIAHNYTINYLKSSKYKKIKNLADYNDQFIPGETDIEESIINDERINSVVLIMKKVLSTKHLRIMTLHFFTNFSVKEISETLDIPEKTIYKAIKTSIEKIKKEVDDNE
ncbi:MAG: RNA polymerase sigma factor, partial [Candidatus Izemoplasma sp.]